MMYNACVCGTVAAVLLVFGLQAVPAQNAALMEVGEVLEVIDFRNVALADAMRLFSLQTDLRIVPSAKAGKEKINLFLTNVKAGVALAALADSNRFVVEMDRATAVITIYAREEAKAGHDFAPGPKGGPEGRLVYPKIVVKGRVLNKTEPPAALLEVDGRLLLVARLATFSVGGLNFRVEEVNASQVRIMDIQRNQAFTVN